MRPRSRLHSATVGLAVVAASFCGVLARALWADPGAPPPHATEFEREQLRQAFAHAEQGWREEARAAFPGDLWSQDDDFQRREVVRAREWAQRLRVPLADVLDEIDRGLRAEPWPGEVRRATVHACKPRPFYD